MKLIVKKLPAFYGTERFITVFTKVTTGPYPEQNQSEYRLIQLEMLCDVR